MRAILALLALASLAAVPGPVAAAGAIDAADVERACERGWPSSGTCSSLTLAFYDSTGGAPAWSGPSGPTARAREVAAVLGDARRKGLRAEDYQPAEGDVAFTVSVLRYLSDLALGRVSPRALEWKIDVGPAPDRDLGALLRAVQGAGDLPGALAAAEPAYPAYHRTLAALDRYLALAAEGEGEPLPQVRRRVDPGDRWPGTRPLAALLRRVGDLPAGGEPEAGEVYQGALVEAVKRFQLRHGLEPDGVLGGRTLEQLRVPFGRRVEQLELALERWRWLPRRLEAPLLFVNIPEFRLHAVDPDPARRLSMKVVVGKAYRTQTPVFAASLRQVVFRPPWTVPLGIQRQELVPAAERDPRYLARHDYEVLDRRGAVVGEVGAEELRALRAGALQLRQRPGPRNALGLVKFVLPNRHDVYLHATPSTKLFARSRRDFSHGCIRVEDPVGLATWALRERPEWTAERIRGAMDGTRTLAVNLPRTIPVLIVYGTALVAEDGLVRFLDDLYGLDAELARALRARPRLAG